MLDVVHDSHRQSLAGAAKIIRMAGMASASFSSDEQHAIKWGVTSGRSYADRISLAFAMRLFMVKTGLREDHLILDEMDYLEGLRSHSKTKREEQFRYPPLHQFWHKHYSAPRHILRNIGIRWAHASRAEQNAR
ncbi:MAG: hypothetical protein WBD95_16400 [Xanthobacteraceae bacterium]